MNGEQYEEKKEKTMMLVEGMKRLRVIEKRMANNSARINDYAAMVSTEKSYFETDDRQKQEIKKLIQSNTDLLDEYLNLKKRIEYTNLSTTIEMGGRTYAISDLLVIKRKLASMMINTYNSLNDGQAKGRLSRLSIGDTTSGQRPHVVRLYREEDKIEGLQKWQDLEDNIESRLEVINATTPLMSLPS
jgi:hypothetical protein